MKKTTFALLAILTLVTPASATVWTLKDYWPNLTPASQCAIENDGSASQSHDWYVVAEPLATCTGAPSGSCWRRGINPNRSQGSAYSGHAWDYDLTGTDGQSYYFGYIIYHTDGTIETLQMLNPMTNPYLPASVDDGSANPLADTIYYSGATTTLYTSTWELVSQNTVYGWSRVKVENIADPALGSPYIALRVDSFSGPSGTGPSGTGPWTALESITLSSNLLSSDTSNCGSSAYSYKGLYEWSASGTILIRTYGSGWQYHP